MSNKIAKEYNISPGNPANITVPYNHGAMIASGIFQGVGALTLLIQLYGGNVTKVINLNDLTQFSSNYFTISGSNSVVNFATTAQGITVFYATMLC